MSTQLPESDLISAKKCIILYASLAEKLGLNEAIVVQQLHFLLGLNGGKTINGEHWIFNTYEQWQSDHFPWWSVNTIQRIFCNLEDMLIVESCQPDGHMSRKKYYRLNHGMVTKLIKGSLPKQESSKTPMISEDTKMGSSSPQNGVMEDTKMVGSLTEGTQRVLNRESKETSPAEDVCYFSEQKPSERSKEDQLKRIQTPKDYPSEDEFNDCLSDNDLGNIINYRQDLYAELRHNKWHQWKFNRWVPIRDWVAYVIAFEDHLDKTFR